MTSARLQVSQACRRVVAAIRGVALPVLAPVPWLAATLMLARNPVRAAGGAHRRPAMCVPVTLAQVRAAELEDWPLLPLPDHPTGSLLALWLVEEARRP